MYSAPLGQQAEKGWFGWQTDGAKSVKEKGKVR